MAEELLARLNAKLDAVDGPLARWERYYSGAQGLAYATDRWKREFGRLLANLGANWPRLVVDSVTERLAVAGFRFGDEQADEDAWAIWQENRLDADSGLLHTSALVHGGAFTMVWPDANGRPRISVESARQVTVLHGAGDRRHRVAALKRWVEVDGYARAVLFTPDTVSFYKSASRAAFPETGATVPLASGAVWVTEKETIENPLGVVPVVSYVNRPTLFGDGGVSEIADVAHLTDAANKITADMVLASEFGAFRQRWATGLDVPTDEETNQPIDTFLEAVGRVWISVDENTKFGEFDATELSNYVAAHDALVQAIASVSQTPAHYFTAWRGQMPSGESLKSAEAGLVAKARRAQRSFGESHEETMRLAFLVLGDERAGRTDAECVWGDAESRTDSERADALVKLGSLDVPREQLWADWGYSPQQVALFREMRRRDALDGVALDLGETA
jgi:hypothetical protein